MPHVPAVSSSQVASVATSTLPSETPSTGVPRHFRADIQALRAIAVVLVVVYHLRPNRVSGGYIGVDVFFVISGFLITGHLVREAGRTGRVRLGAFWAARARRILPASLVALAVTVAVTAWVAPVTLLEDLRRQALASLFYVENWVLAADAVDYSAADNQATAFQHFWSLSVEEQFYVFWPLLVVAALWVVARRTAGRGDERLLRRVLVVFFSIVVAASLAFSIFAVADGQANAYFVTTTRIWELGAGGLLAVLGGRALGRGWRYLIAYLGLIAIAVSALTLTSESPFPGLAALPVILGTMALIFAGTDHEPDDQVALARFDPWTFGSRLRLTQWIGDRSYSLYLWHFPVIIIWTMVIDRKLGYLDIVGMLVLSVVLADLSYRFIEQPMRRADYFRLSTRHSLVGAAIAMAIVAVITFAYPVMAARTAGGGDWDDLAATSRTMPEIGAAAVSAGSIPTFVTTSPAMTPSPLEAKEDRNIAFSAEECVADMKDDVTPRCQAGPSSATESVVLVGDSHARMYSTALAEMAEDEGWSLTTYLRNACPFSPTMRNREADRETICVGPNAEVMAAILADPPDLVITTWSQVATFVDDGSADVPGSQGFADYWNRLEDAGSDVLVVRDVPRMDTEVPDCVAENYDNPDECGLPRDEAIVDSPVLDAAVALAPRVDVADFTDLFCTEDFCKPVIGSVLAYHDTDHITDTFAVTMIPQLRSEMEEALTRG